MSYRARWLKNRRAGGALRSFPSGHWPNPGLKNCLRSQGACALLPSSVSCKRISANCVETCHCSARCILRMNFWLRILQALDLVNVHALDISSCRQASLRIRFQHSVSLELFQCAIDPRCRDCAVHAANRLGTPHSCNVIFGEYARIAKHFALLRQSTASVLQQFGA